MTKEHLERLEALWKVRFVKGWDRLLTLLKQHGGEMMVPQKEPEEHVQWLLEKGRIYDTGKLKFVPGGTSNSHENAGLMWANDKQLQIVTGYVLSLDGELWSQCSWLFNLATGEMIVTTGPGTKYFGVELDETQALKFAFENNPGISDPKTVAPRIVLAAAEVVFKHGKPELPK